MSRYCFVLLASVLVAACWPTSSRDKIEFRSARTPVVWKVAPFDGQQDPDPKVADSKGADAEYKLLDADFQKAIDELRELISQADSKDQKIRLLATRNPAPLFADRFLALARKHPSTQAGLNAVMFVVQRTSGSQKNEAMVLLIEKYHDQVSLLKVAQSLTGEVPSPNVESWLKMMIAHAGSDMEKANMTITFAKYVGQIPYFKRTIAMNPVLNQRYSVEQMDYINTPRSSKQDDELAAMLQMVIDQAKDSKSGMRRFGSLAEQELYDLKNLQVGMIAPEIQGDDFDEVPFKLSDYRGKVVMLDFWGHWCPPCRAMYGHEREITKKLADKPFVLLGVNSDRNKEVATDALRDEGLSWRHFWNGPQGRNGPISSQWNVEGWPTVYLIDPDGVIRYKGVLGEDLDRGIETLMAEIGHKVQLNEE